MTTNTSNRPSETSTNAAGSYFWVNGLNMYYEVHGTGTPLLLLHGALSSISDFGMVIPYFADTRQVIAPERQAHGHTADIDRPFSLEQMADDTAALLRHLNIERADVFGYSMGGTIALGLAIRHPGLVRRLVIVETIYNEEGYLPEMLEGLKHMTADGLPPQLRDTYTSVAPNPEDFGTLVAKTSQLVAEFKGWRTEDIQSIHAPTLVMVGDAGIVRPEHTTQLFHLFRHAHLAVLPRTDHIMRLYSPDWLNAMIADFLDAPMPETDLDITRLRDEISGEIILPGDTNYDAARQVHNLLHDGRPALIVRPVDADDVVSAVRFAADLGLTIAVRGGGHSAAGFGTVDGGIVIDLSSMRAIAIDPDARIARAQGGITAGEYTAATIAHGLITPFGDSPSVGIGGITLGGGVGWLSRKLGMTIDSLLAAELVTADGRKLRVSATEHPDLFWAIRGGGGNFGIVTSFEFRLHPIDTVLGGALYLPPTRDVIRSVIDLSRQAPDELTTITLVMRILPLPEMPEALHGQLAVIVMPVWAGDLEAGQRVLAPFRALAEPMADLVRPMPFSAMYEMLAAAGEPITNIARAFTADSLDDAAIDAMLGHLEKPRLPSRSSTAVVQIRVLGGAMARVPADATAFAHRDATLMVAIATLGFEQTELDVHRVWAESVFAAMGHVSTGAYLNFLEAEGDARIREAYPEPTYQRLAEVKRRYDPENRFHLNQNVRPANA